MKVFQSHQQRERRAGSAMKLAALAGLGLVALPGLAQAANLEWNVADGDWSVAGNWNPNQVPGPGDFAFVSNTVTGSTARVTTDVPDTDGVFVFNNNTLRIESGGDLNVSNASSSPLDGIRIGDGLGLTGTAGNGQAVVTGTGRLSTSGTSDGNYIRVGVDGGNGTLTQDGGLVLAQRDLIVGQNNSVSTSAGGRTGSVGVYNLSGGTTQVVGGWANVGQNGATGTFNVSGTGTFIVGNDNVATNPATGRRDDKNFNVGLDGGTGVVNQDGGTVNVSSWTFVGRQGGSNGTYNQSGGTHSTSGWVRIGENATGAYNLSGNAVLNIGAVAGGIGDNDFGDDLLYVGVEGSGTATLNVEGSAAVNVGNGMLIGAGGATGAVTQTGGSVNVTNFASVGTDASSAAVEGSYAISGGSLAVGGDLNVADNANTVGNMTVSGTGAVNAGTMFVGKSTGSTGTLTQSGGTITASNVTVGRNAGTGVVNQSGGTTTASSIVRIGFNEAGGGGGVGTYTIGGSAELHVTGGLGRIELGNGLNSVGTLNVNDNALVTMADDFRIGTGGQSGPPVVNGGTGTVNQTGGIVRFGTVSGTDADPATVGILTVGGFFSTGTYNLSGGILDGTGGIITFSAGPVAADFNFTGGRIEDVSAINFFLEQEGGTLAPGASPGTTTIVGNGTNSYTLGALGTLEIELQGLAAGIEYDQLIANNGLVTLLGNLDLIAGPGLMAGEYLILLNDGTDAITGMFAGRAEGSMFIEDGYEFTITYLGGDGNDVALTLVPEPTSLALLGIGAMGLLARRRRNSAA